MSPSHDAGRYTGEVTSGVPAAPVAGFTDVVDATTGNVTFTDTSKPGSDNGAIVAYAWSFGDPKPPDGDSSTLQNPMHTYLVSGTYAVTLLVLDAEGLSARVSETVIVRPESGGVQGPVPSG